MYTALPTPVVSQDKTIPVIPAVESHTVVTQIERLMEDFKLGKIDAPTLNLQIMELSKEISTEKESAPKVTEMRSLYMSLLSINNEEVQKPTVKVLAYFLATETIKNDIDDNQAQQLVELASTLSNIIASHLTNRGSKELLYSLLDLYENLLEHLWLLPCLVKDRGVYATIVENSSPLIHARSESWMNWLEKEAEEDKSLRSHFDGIKQAHRRISNPPQLDNEEIVGLQDSIGRPFFRSDLGNIYLELQDYSRAILHYEACLIPIKDFIDDLHKNSKDTNEIRNLQSFLGKIHGNLGSCYRALGNREQALQNHVRHLELSQALGDWDTEAKVCANIGNVYFKSGHSHFSSNDDDDHALEWYRRGFKIAEQHNHDELQRYFYDTILKLSERSLSLAQYFSEHLTKAKGCLNRALLGSQIITNTLLEAHVCGELGVLYGKERNFDLAFEYTKRFLSIAEEKQSLALQGKAHGNLGIIYSLQGNYIRAAEETEKQLAIAQADGDLITQGKAYVALGNIYKALKQDERAAEYFEKHLAIVEQRYKESINDTSRGVDFRLMHEYSTACSNVGIMYFHTMQFDKAISCMQRILAVVKEIELRGFTLEPTILDIRSTANEILIKIYRETEKYDLAIQKCNENLDNDLAVEKISGTEKISKGSTYSNLAQIYVYMKEYEKAREQFQNALNVFERLNYENGIKLANCNLGAIYRIFKDFEKAKSCYGRAIEIAQRQQQRLKEKDEWKITLFEEQAYAYIGLEKVLLQEGNSDEALKVSEYRRSRSLVEALKRRSVRGSVIDSDLTVNEIQEIAKQKNTTLVVYSAVPFDTARLAVWIIAPSGSIEHKLLSIEPLQKDIQGFEDLLKEMPFERTRGKSPDISIPCLKEFEELVRGEELLAVQLARQEFIEEKLGPWYQSLISPIEKYLPSDPNQTVTIIPDSFLSQLPFAAFHDASDNKYLIEKHPISIAPSIHTLKILDDIALSRNTEQHSKQALIIGNPTLNDPKYAELAIGEQEAEEVAGLLNSKLFKQSEATVANFVQQASQAHWIFASCHGEADCKPDQDPYSVFEGQLKFSPDPEHPTGNLHSQLISTLDLKAELVFLSACYSGTGKVQQEGTIGNVWSFLSAGALSTVATYWPLKESETTKEMVNCFYKHVLEIEAPKLNKAQALQRAMIFGMEKDRDNIAQWGAFFLSGLSN